MVPKFITRIPKGKPGHINVYDAKQMAAFERKWHVNRSRITEVVGLVGTRREAVLRYIRENLMPKMREALYRTPHRY